MRWLFGEQAEMLFQILPSNGTFNVNVAYDGVALSPPSDGTNGVASPFKDELACRKDEAENEMF